MTTIFASAFLLGIISNLHCLGMCGPISLAIPLDRSSKFSMFIGSLQYNLGRIFTYSILGGIVGFIGLGIHLIGILQSISVLAGIGIILYAWRKQLFRGAFFQKMNGNFLQKFISANMGKIFRTQPKFKRILLGSLNGLLPCGMVYTALITSIVAGSPFYSAVTMVVFGIGTLPTMMIITIFSSEISVSTRGKINRALPYLVTFIGFLIILRGLNLDIPYVSPKASFNAQTKEINVEGCHSPILLKP